MMPLELERLEKDGIESFPAETRRFIESRLAWAKQIYLSTFEFPSRTIDKDEKQNKVKIPSSIPYLDEIVKRKYELAIVAVTFVVGLMFWRKLR
jgi:hypothetical protein